MTEEMQVKLLETPEAKIGAKRVEGYYIAGHRSKDGARRKKKALRR